jgi:hypothetical protein
MEAPTRCIYSIIRGCDFAVLKRKFGEVAEIDISEVKKIGCSGSRPQTVWNVPLAEFHACMPPLSGRPPTIAELFTFSKMWQKTPFLDTRSCGTLRR